MKTVWVDIFRIGAAVHHPAGTVEITRDFAEDILRNFDGLRLKGYATTVLREHGRQDSYVYGEVHGLRIDESNGYVQAAVEFYRDEDKQAYNAGILREFSPGFAMGWKDPHTGEEMQHVLLEVSFTARAYQRNLRAPQDLNPGVTLHEDVPLHLSHEGTTCLLITERPTQEESLMVEQQNAEAAEESAVEFSAEDYEAAMARIEELEAQLAEVEAQLAQVEAEEEEAEVKEVEETEEDEGEVARLSARIAELEAHNTRLELAAKGIEGETANALVELAGINRDLFERQVKTIVELSAGRSTVQEEIGAPGVADVEGTMQLSEVAVAAQAAGALAPGRLTLWLASNHPELFGQENEIRSAAQ